MKNSIYLIATYVRSPKDRNGNYHYDEVVGFAKRIKESDLRACNVIIDLLEKTVVKCSVSENNDTFGNKNFEDIYNYFHNHYPEALDSVKPNTEVVATV